MDRDAALEHCRDLVRSHDRDSYLASLLAPGRARPFLWALYAFNYEIARIRSIVSEPGLGEIRLQWWLETVEGLYRSTVPAQPVAMGLARAIEAGDLPKTALLNLIEARRFDLYGDPMPSLADLEGYLGETSSALIQLASLLLAGSKAGESAPTAGLAGVAWGIAGLLSALPVQLSRGQCYVPRDILARHGLTPESFLAGPRGEGTAAVGELIGIARARLKMARESAAVPASALPAFYPAGLTELYLDALERKGAAVLETATDVGQLARQWRLWRMSRTGRF